MAETWAEQFAPIAQRGWDIRPEQEKLGNAIIKTITYGGTLVGEAPCGTGKSLASLIPIIKNIQAHKPESNYRAVISTETLTLQRQLVTKDLPFLQEVYGSFTYKKLMGRSNYLCFNRAKDEAVGDPTGQRERLRLKIDSKRQSLTTGEKEDVERALGRPMTIEEWARLSGSSDYCADNKCSEDECFSSKARVEALQADIVVVNHKILAIDHDMKQKTGSFGTNPDGMLGEINAIVVDEAHKLEDVLSEQWSEKYTEYEITDHINRLVAAVDMANMYNKGKKDFTDRLSDELLNFLMVTKKFFMAIEERYSREWDGSENPFCMQFIDHPSDNLRELMNTFETTGPALMDLILESEESMSKFFRDSIEIMSDQSVANKFKTVVRKGKTSMNFLATFAKIIGGAMESKDGVVRTNGFTYGVTVNGWTSRRTHEQGMSIRAIPLDVSLSAKDIWASATSSILMSATLEDLTSKDFAYFKRSMGISACKEIKVKSPFAMEKQQLVYITPQPYPSEEGTVFSVQEIVDSVEASKGRSLVLFTSRKDLNMSEKMLLDMKIAGNFNYTLLVQTPDADKAKLVEDFKEDTSSVLLGLKSMFTGIDIPGESLSNVIICRFPLSRYSAECKMKINYWRTQGFHNWYERDSLTVFQQAAGRLIRSEGCIGVVSILDQRINTVGSNVFKTAKTGITALGSRVTQDINDVSVHLGELSAV